MEKNEKNILDELSVGKHPDVPTDYFSSISTSILSKIENQEKVDKPKNNIQFGLIAACASVLLFLGLQYGMTDSVAPAVKQNQLAQLTLTEDEEEIVDFLDEMTTIDFDEIEFNEIDLDLDEI